MIMPKSQALKFATEVAPPQLVSVVRKEKVSKFMETIVEEERDNAVSSSLSSSSSSSSSSSYCKSSSSFFGKDKSLSGFNFLSWLPKKLACMMPM